MLITHWKQLKDDVIICRQIWVLRDIFYLLLNVAYFREIFS